MHAIGSTATVRGSVLRECNGRVARVEEYNADAKLYTCSVALQGGLEEVVQLDVSQLENVLAPKKARLARVRVERRTCNDYFFPEFANSRIANWMAMYRDAFQAEHAWLEQCGIKTSSGLETDPELMIGLVFLQAQHPFARQCFFAFGNDAKDACGIATVDIDPDPRKVCHVRMLMVDPAMQGLGVGLTLLEHVVDQFKHRNLGLKFTNHRSLEAFYQKAGFTRIGQDTLYTYMAIRRVK